MKRPKLSDRRPLRGAISVPGDKSISHRALVLAGLARGLSVVRGVNLGDDVRATAGALQLLGVGCRVDDANREVKVEGRGWDGLEEPEDVIDAGNSGTTVRTLAGVCAAIEGLSILSGDATLRHRPMLRVVAPLRQMGAAIDGRAHGDRAPLAIRGGDLSGIDLEMTVASAQVKTAVLLAGLRATGTTSVTEPVPSRDHTERMLAAAGIEVRAQGATVSVDGGEPAPLDWRIPGDVSAAMFLVVAALLLPGSDLIITDVGINPTRSGGLDALAGMGAQLDVDVLDNVGGEPVGRIAARTSDLKGVRIADAEASGVMDEIPVLAVAATQAEGETVVTGAQELRVKESDRIAAMVEGLRALGADVEELPDGIVIRGPTRLAGGTIDSRGDHRIALAFAVAGLVAQGPVRVNGWGCVDTSFPEFLDVLGRAQGR